MDAILSLAFSMQSNKGVYALLLGSGISRSSGIPTGWDIVLDLIGKLANAEDNIQPDNLEEWYYKKYGTAPDYCDILNKVGKTPAERQKLLEQYFVPTEDERLDGKKTPTQAHKSIASLVAAGFIRMIITTNFDQLLEDALRTEGIKPDIIATVDAIKGATPYVHSKCVILKVHGDYKDQRIKNTAEEVAEYEDEMNQYLDRIFDDFGLIISGWSADWDIALRNALTRKANRRYTTYWTGISNVGEASDASRLIHHLKAEQIIVKGADDFFLSLHDMVYAIAEQGTQHPAKAEVAVSLVKRYLSRDDYHIKLREMFIRESRMAAKKIAPFFSNEVHNQPTPEAFQKHLHFYEVAINLLLFMYAEGCYFDRDYNTVWEASLLTLINVPLSVRGGYREWTVLLRYPAILLHYVAGIAFLASGNMKAVHALLSMDRLRDDYGTPVPAHQFFSPRYAFSDIKQNASELFSNGDQGYMSPEYIYIRELLPKYFENIISAEECVYCFDTIDLLKGLYELNQNDNWDEIYLFSSGALYFKRMYHGIQVDDEFFKHNHMIHLDSLLEAGAMAGSKKRFNDCLTKYVEMTTQISASSIISGY